MAWWQTRPSPVRVPSSAEIAPAQTTAMPTHWPWLRVAASMRSSGSPAARARSSTPASQASTA
eukprot:scaffold2244_cov91-Isochrysis_galbana.AAC.4